MSLGLVMERGHHARQCARRTHGNWWSRNVALRAQADRMSAFRSDGRQTHPPFALNFAEKIASAISSAQHSSRQEDDSEQDVNDVIHLAEH